MKFTQILVATAALAVVDAHMKLANPVPYSSDSLNNSPLERSGSDYPCKLRPNAFQVTKMNNWKAGEKQTISFTGSAVHGGGSCQFALTTDTEPSPKSQFKVIHSVIGGCPSNVTGNLPENSNGGGAATFDVEIPKDIPDGQYSFAWTWFNKVGNREMYMNCAPVTVSGGGGDISALAKLPDLFVANIPDTSCATVEGTDFQFPEPGPSKQIEPGAAIGSVLNGAGCAAMTKMGAGSGNMNPPAKGPGGAAPPVAPTAAPAAPPTNTGGVLAPSASSAPDQAETSFTTLVATKTVTLPEPTGGAPVQPPPASNAPPASPPAGGAPASGNAPASGGPVACSTEGAVVCIGSNQFGLCNHGFAVAQDLASGTTCQGGAIVKRSGRHRRAHALRSRQHGSGSL